MLRANIVGAGLAGLSAALTLARAGVACRLVSPQQSERAQSVLAEGGINAALDLMDEHDSYAEHFDDTMRGAVWLADPNAVWGLAHEAPDVVRDFIGLGVPFQTEHGRMIQRNFGGQKKKRTAYAQSSTGKVLVTALIDAVRRFEAGEDALVERLPRHELVELCVREGCVCGVWVRNVYTDELRFLDGPVIGAYGGMGGMFGTLTTGTTQSSGDVAAKLFAQGVEMGNLEMLQYHPTTVRITGKRMLISEAARGEGGRLYIERDGAPWYFMEEIFPELGNLMPRDVVSRTEYKVLHNPSCGGQVYLDMTALSKSVWKTRLPDLREEVIHYMGIDPVKTPIPVEPGIHYCMGGAYVDAEHRTSLRGLYAAGECACQFHGANRLGGNSLLGATYGGRVAARTLMADAQAGLLTGAVGDVSTGCGERACSARRDAEHAVSSGNAGSERVEAAAGRPGDAVTMAHSERSAPEPPAFPYGANKLLPQDNAAEGAMQEALLHGMGIVRTEAECDEALALLDAIDTDDVSPRMLDRLRLARAIVTSARERRESRGAHWRSDYPETLEEQRLTSVARCTGVGLADVAVEHRAIPELRRELRAGLDAARSGTACASDACTGAAARGKSAR